LPRFQDLAKFRRTKAEAVSDAITIRGGCERQEKLSPPRTEFLLGGKPAYMTEDSHTSNETGAVE
jgi:hypothetical protein